MSDRFGATISGQSSARNTAQLLALTLASREAMDFQVSVKTSATDGAAPNSAGVRLGFRSFTARANTQTTALPGAIMLITGETLIRTGEFRVAKYCGNWRALTKYCKHEAIREILQEYAQANRYRMICRDGRAGPRNSKA